MSLERKDVRFKVSAEVHQGLVAVSESDGQEINEWVEAVVQREVVRRITAAKVIVDRTARLGISGNGRESAADA